MILSIPGGPSPSFVSFLPLFSFMCPNGADPKHQCFPSRKHLNPFSPYILMNTPLSLQLVATIVLGPRVPLSVSICDWRLHTSMRIRSQQSSRKWSNKPQLQVESRFFNNGCQSHLITRLNLAEHRLFVFLFVGFFPLIHKQTAIWEDRSVVRTN